MHPEALGGGVEQFEAAVEARSCPYLNELGSTALNEMREVYERLDAGDYDALGEIAERLAAAVEQKTPAEHQAMDREERPMFIERTEPAPEAEQKAALLPREAHEERRDLGVLIPNTLGREEPDPVKVMPERAEPATQENEEQRVLRAEPEPLLHPELALLLSQAASSNLLQEEQGREEALREPILETAPPIPEPLQVETAEKIIHTPRREPTETRQEPEISPRRPAIIPEQIDHAETDVPELTEAPAELSSAGTEPFAIAKETPESDKKETEAIQVPVVADVLYYERIEPLDWVAAPDVSEAAAIDSPSDNRDELMAWPNVEIIDRELAQIYESFCQALQPLADRPGKETEPSVPSGMYAAEAYELVDDGSDKEPDNGKEAKELPAIAAVLAERLDELKNDDQEAAVLVVADIVTKTRFIKAREQEGAAEEAAEAKLELKRSLTEIFEQLRIEFEAEDIEEFINFLLSPDFLPPQTEAAEIAAADLEHDGTREAKRHFPYRLSSLMIVEDKMRHLLGSLTLFYVLRGGQEFQTIAG